MKRRAAQRGFSLIEVLLALMIFSVVMISITQALTTQVRAQNSAEDTTRAVILAENILEELRLETFLIEEERDGSFEGSNTGFKWWYKLEETDVSGMKKVTVRISREKGRTHEVEAYLTER